MSQLPPFGNNMGQPFTGGGQGEGQGQGYGMNYEQNQGNHGMQDPYQQFVGQQPQHSAKEHQASQELILYHIDNEHFYVTPEYDVSIEYGIIGRGTFGAVCVAKMVNPTTLEPLLNVAIKKILIQPHMLGRVFRELKLHKSLMHPNIVQLRDIMPIYPKPPLNNNEQPRNIQVLMVMDCMGSTLTDALRKRKHTGTNMTIENICWMRDILNGLAYLHAHQIVHRDLKPDNIMLGEPPNAYSPEQIKLADFGQSKQQNYDPYMSYVQIVTVYYRPPELLTTDIRQHILSGSIDMWAAGCIFAEMLFGGNLIYVGKKDSDAIRRLRELVGLTPALLQMYQHTAQAVYQQQPLGNQPHVQFRGIPRDHPRFHEHMTALTNHVNPAAISLLLWMLAPREDRISAVRALQHPYFTHADPQQFSPQDVAQAISAFDMQQHQIRGADEPLANKQLVNAQPLDIREVRMSDVADFVRSFNFSVKNRIGYDRLKAREYVPPATYYRALLAGTAYDFYWPSKRYWGQIFIRGMRTLGVNRYTFEIEVEKRSLQAVVVRGANCDEEVRRLLACQRCEWLQTITDAISVPPYHTRISPIYPFTIADVLEKIQPENAEVRKTLISNWARQLIKATLFMHDQGFAHFNIHPMALRFRPTELSKSFLMYPLMMTGLRLGPLQDMPQDPFIASCFHPRYWSETERSLVFDQWMDLWNLACTFYFCATLNPLFPPEAGPLQVQLRSRQGAWFPPQFCANFPQAVRAFSTILDHVALPMDERSYAAVRVPLETFARSSLERDLDGHFDAYKHYRVTNATQPITHEIGPYQVDDTFLH